MGIALSARSCRRNLARVKAAIRGEQVMGTLEMVFLTPTAPTTVQLGSVVYDLDLRADPDPDLPRAFDGLLDLRSRSTARPVPALGSCSFIPFLWGSA